MPWTDSLNGDSLAWLLSSPTPGVRYPALRDLLDRPADDPDLRAARSEALQHGPAAVILANMQPEGFWVKPGPGYGPKYTSTVWAIQALAQVGMTVDDDPRIATACAYLLDHALAPQGQFSHNGAPGGTFDCLQGNLSWALTALGCADPRLDTAFEWMARTVTGEGMAESSDKKNPMRYTAYKCAPLFACGANNKYPCAWGAAKVMMAFSALPRDRRTPLIDRAVQAGVEFFLGIDPATGAYPTSSGQPPSGDWWKFGFPVYYITDILQIVEALVALGCGADPRLANALQLVRSKQDENGRWL
ncbi:MAG: nitrogen fixation protein NifH, partial [Anaerolineaceae bacterium]